jgi:hypothetical protein
MTHGRAAKREADITKQSRIFQTSDVDVLATSNRVAILAP